MEKLLVLNDRSTIALHLLCHQLMRLVNVLQYASSAYKLIPRI